MPRYKLIIEYDGTPFVGWQLQDNGAVGAGRARRRDRGVLPARRPTVRARAAPMPACMRSARWRISISRRTGDTDTVRDALNAHLRPHPVAVLAAERVADDFDARFSAVQRHYLYRIVNRRADLALERGRAWRVPRPLDAAAMHAAAQRLVGKHDFTTFRSTECQAKSPVKTLDRLDVTRAGEEVNIIAVGALVPAQSGALDGRLAGAGRRRQMERRRSCARARGARPRAPAGRSRRRTGFIWCGWIIDRILSLSTACCYVWIP